MGKGNRRRKRPTAPSTSSSWKPVPVHLGGGQRREEEEPEARTITTAETSNDFTDDGDDDDAGRFNNNHYDDPKLSKTAERDLHMQPGEDCAIFFGLEVLDASHYQVVQDGTSKRLIVKRDDDDTKTPSPPSSDPTQESSLEVGPPKTKKQKKETEKQKKVTKTKDSVDQSESSGSATPPAEKSENEKASVTTDGDDKPKQKKTKKKDKKVTEPSDQESHQEQEGKQPRTVSADELQTVQSSWSDGTGGAHLHPQLIESLCRLGFTSPTPIQAATLTAAIMGRRNMVGAAPTGSGKTLAFLLPILDRLLADQEEQPQPHEKRSVKALIMTPTRELATQIHKECEKLVPNQCVTLVGGIALVKQTRLLQTKRPSIIVGTPGRVFQMLSSGDHDHLHDLSNIQFLVLDEADRMTQEHCFPQMIKILDMIHAANPGDTSDDGESDEEDDEDDEGGNRLMGLPGVPGEAHLAMLSDDILRQIEAQREGMDPESKEIADDSFPTQSEPNDIDEEVKNLEEAMPDEWVVKPRIKRQTFIFSATLTLPFTKTKNAPVATKKRKKLGLDGGIAEILEKTRAMGETKVVDLSSSTSSSNDIRSNSSQHGVGVRLPPGLSVEQIKCTQRHKDSHLYAYLMTTSQGTSGPCLVFCNSIAAVRRVGATLQALGFAVRILHAHMQQRARFKAVESLSDSNSRSVVVCTDVAARGLDIPSVSTVIHYDVARTVDSFVHRSGRTARGMGEGATGSSLSLVAPAEDKAHSKIAEAANVTFTKVMLDGRLLTASQERTNLASKIIAAAEMEQKTNSSNKWFLEKAKEAELDLDDDLMEDESNRPEKELQQLREARKAKARLAKLLAEPMKTQRFGKFLSTNSASMQKETMPLKKVQK